MVGCASKTRLTHPTRRRPPERRRRGASKAAFPRGPWELGGSRGRDQRGVSKSGARPFSQNGRGGTADIICRGGNVGHGPTQSSPSLRPHRTAPLRHATAVLALEETSRFSRRLKPNRIGPGRVRGTKGLHRRTFVIHGRAPRHGRPVVLRAGTRTFEPRRGR